MKGQTTTNNGTGNKLMIGTTCTPCLLYVRKLIKMHG